VMSLLLLRALDLRFSNVLLILLLLKSFFVLGFPTVGEISHNVLVFTTPHRLKAAELPAALAQLVGAGVFA
jgi:hypothetical protein